MDEPREKPHRLPPSSYVGQIPISFTACVGHRRHAFLTAANVGPHVEIMREQFAKFDCLIPIYCFMPDHLHVISMGMTHHSDGKRAMDAFEQKSADLLYSSGDHFRWQKDYHDRIIRRSEEWRKQVFYVFLNPVRSKIVSDPRGYPFTGSIGYDLEELLHGQ